MLLSIQPARTTCCNGIFNQNEEKKIMKENATENMVWEISDILFRFQCNKWEFSKAIESHHNKLPHTSCLQDIWLVWAHETWTKWLLFCRQHFQMHLLNENYCVLIQISLKFVAMSRIDKTSSFVQVMAWCQFSTKPLPEPMTTQSNVLNTFRAEETWPLVADDNFLQISL